MNYTDNRFPQQRLPYRQKTAKWRKACVDWGVNKPSVNIETVRSSYQHKRINANLVEGKLDMDDLQLVLNPDNIQAGFIPERIQHYPIINSKLNILRGEEFKRPFDFRVVVTNPNAISQIEEDKKQALFQALQQLIADQSLSDEEFNRKLDELDQYFSYSWQDIREIRANYILNHYSKEQNFALQFNDGMYDGMVFGEEIYQCDIIGGEPTLMKVNPFTLDMWRSGYSNKIEDADVITITEYWSPGKIADTYYDVLTPKDLKHLEEYFKQDSVSGVNPDTGEYDERFAFVGPEGIAVTGGDFYFNPFNLFGEKTDITEPFDNFGNIRVVRMYWKSSRKVKKVKSYDPQTGKEMYEFYTEDYVTRDYLGEEETILWINEAWEGTKIGEDIYVNMRPRPIQYNRLSNPSRCHFGIVGSIYTINGDKPFSMVDMMKPYNYLYDVIHDRLNKAIAANWGSILEMDLAKVPYGWTPEKWLYFAKINHIAVIDSFKEGTKGQSTGKLAASINNTSKGIMDSNIGNYIQQLMNLLEFIKLEMSEVVGISKQREGQVSNRETVGGVERATLQSSHITEWVFTIHNDVKKRALECFLETAKIAQKGNKYKFQYILPDYAQRVIDVDGDEFAECDYGILVDDSNNAADQNGRLETLVQAGLQNQMIGFSTAMKIFSTCSFAEKVRIIEQNEKDLQERAAQAQQAQQQAEQEALAIEMQQKAQELQTKDLMNQRDNETRILVAQIGAASNQQGEDLGDSSENREELMEKMRQFDAKLKLEYAKLDQQRRAQNETMAFNREKLKVDSHLKEKQINKQKATAKK